MTSQKFIIFFYRKKLRTSDKKTDQEICVNQRDAAVFRDQRAAFGVIFLKKKPVCINGLGECVYQISGLYRFLFGLWVRHKPIHPQTYILANIKSLRLVRLTWIRQLEVVINLQQISFLFFFFQNKIVLVPVWGQRSLRVFLSKNKSNIFDDYWSWYGKPLNKVIRVTTRPSCVIAKILALLTERVIVQNPQVVTNGAGCSTPEMSNLGAVDLKSTQAESLLEPPIL